MKKLTILFLSGLLILTFGAGAFAQDKLEFKASGFMEATSFWYRNIPDIRQTKGSIITPFPAPWRPESTNVPPTIANLNTWGAWDRKIAYWEYRAFLRFDAVYGKALSGTFLFELDSSRWGDYSAGADLSQRGSMGYWTADRNAIEIKNVYFDAALPYIGIPVPMSLRVGLQPIGVRPNMFLITDGMGITGSIKIDPVTIIPIYAKALEGRDASSDDVDVYGLHVNAKVATFTIGGYGVNYNMNTYPLNAWTTLATVGTTNFPYPTPPNYGESPFYDANFWWLGFYADGKLGPINLNFDFVYDTGKVEARSNKAQALLPGAKDNVKYRGWATRLKIDFPWDKFNFGGVFMYASGADMRKTSAGGFPGEAVWDGAGFARKVGSYVIPPGSEQWAACQESIVFYAPQMSASAVPVGYYAGAGEYTNQVTRGAIGGTWFAKLYASFKATPWYKVTFQALYIGDTTKHGNTVGDAVKLTGRRRDDKTIGWELDLINEINIYKNLKWDIYGGLLFAGDAMDQKIAGVNLNDSPKNPWLIGTKLRYDF